MFLDSRRTFTVQVDFTMPSGRRTENVTVRAYTSEEAMEQAKRGILKRYRGPRDVRAEITLL